MGRSRRHPGRRLLRSLVLSGAVALLAGVLSPATTATAVTSASWAAFLHGPSHSSYNAGATTITPGNAGALSPVLQWQAPAAQAGEPDAALYASPTVKDGVVYIGSHTGHFYALDEVTGEVRWERFLGTTGHYTCKNRGITSTAAVAGDASRSGAQIVYVGGGNGYLYALRASNGTTVWRAPVNVPTPGKNDHYNWTSPTVANGRVYMGISSQCDHPLTRGGVASVDQATGAVVATWYAVGPDEVGGSVWSSVAATSHAVFAATGNGVGDSLSVVKLDSVTLIKKDSWQIPNQGLSDNDFGASPTLFTAQIGGRKVPMVAAIAKSTHIYALDRNDLSAGPVWDVDQHEGHCNSSGDAGAVAGAIWDGTTLYAADGGTTIDGTCYLGEIRAFDPATGSILWETGLAGKVFGTPTIDGAGVIGAATFDFRIATNEEYLVDASDGSILNTIDLAAPAFPQAVFADGYVFAGTSAGDLTSYTPAVPTP
jgi:outer membrane protein assembly factor BamB